MHLSEALRKKGADVTLVSLKKRGLEDNHGEFFGDLGFPILFIDYDWHEEARARLASMTDALVASLPLDFDIYHAQDCVCDTALQALVANGSIKGPTVRTVHHVQGFPDPFIDRCEKNALKANTVKITVSKYWQDELRRRCGIESSVIYNGIDAMRFGGTKPQREPFILFVGGMEGRKGLEFAIEALEMLASRRRELRLVAVARPGFLRTESRQWFDHLVERCGLAGKVDIRELVTDAELVNLYSKASVFLLPTRMEGWGLAIMEAMAAGCPVVSSPVGGVTELVSDGENGLLVRVGDVAAIVESIERLLDDADLRNRLCANAAKTIKEYTWESAAEKTITLYERTLSLRR